MIGAIGQFFSDLAAKVFQIGKLLNFFWSGMIGIVLAILFAPFYWLIALIKWVLVSVANLTGEIEGLVVQLDIKQVSGLWSQAAYYAGLAENFFPVSFALGLLSILFLLWIVVSKIKVFLWLLGLLRGLVK